MWEHSVFASGDGIRVNRLAIAAGQFQFAQHLPHLHYQSTCSPLAVMVGIARLSNPDTAAVVVVGMPRPVVLSQWSNLQWNLEWMPPGRALLPAYTDIPRPCSEHSGTCTCQRNAAAAAANWSGIQRPWRTESYYRSPQHQHHRHPIHPPRCFEFSFDAAGFYM